MSLELFFSSGIFGSWRIQSAYNLFNTQPFGISKGFPQTPTIRAIWETSLARCYCCHSCHDWMLGVLL